MLSASQDTEQYSSLLSCSVTSSSFFTDRVKECTRLSNCSLSIKQAFQTRNLCIPIYSISKKYYMLFMLLLCFLCYFWLIEPKNNKQATGIWCSGDDLVPRGTGYHFFFFTTPLDFTSYLLAQPLTFFSMGICLPTWDSFELYPPQSITCVALTTPITFVFLRL